MLTKKPVFGFVIPLVVCLALLTNFSYAQHNSLNDIKISIAVKNESLDKVFSIIESQSNLGFSYNERYLDLSQIHVTLNFKNTALNVILDEISTQQGLDFRQVGRNIHVIFKPNSPAYLEETNAPITVSGKVFDSENMPLPGVSIVANKSDKGTITDENGAFTIEIPKPNSVLLFSFLGYKSVSQEIDNQSQLEVRMDESILDLGELIVTGYGLVSKSDLTGSIYKLNAKEYTAIPVSNSLEVLQGKIPGLDLIKSNGRPGSNLTINIRGNRSLNAGNDPLILVDGIIYGSTLDVNSNDIASIEVLKDAASTAIYGSLGANGVILITTKKGSNGKSSFKLNSYAGIQTLTGYSDIMNGEEWVNLRRESRRTVGEWQSPQDDRNILAPSQYEAYLNGDFVNWNEEVLGTGSIQNYQASLSGGDRKLLYYSSIEYLKENGLLENDELERYGGRLGIELNLADNLLFSSSLMYTIKNHNNRRNPLNLANKMTPLGRAYNSDGSVRIFPLDNFFVLNPLVDEIPGNYENKELNKRLFGTMQVDWRIVNELNLVSRFGIDNGSSNTGQFSGSNNIELGPNSQTVGRIDNDQVARVTFENYFDYNFSISNSQQISALLGSSLWYYGREQSFLEGRDVLANSLTYHNMGATQDAIRMGSEYARVSMVSFFARLNYKLKDKMIFTGVVRSDGSSVLASGNKWGVFPSGAFAWILHEEDFIGNKSSITNLKLRVSYGVSGNSAVSPYQTAGGLSKSTYSFDVDGKEEPAFGYYPSLLATKNLSWESTNTANIGLDFGFFGDRISGSIDLYQQDTKNLLMKRALPTTSGFASSWDNVGGTRNKGIELILRTVNILSETGINWESTFTFTANKEEITSLINGDRDLANSWFVGFPIQSFYDYNKIGIWQLDEEDEAAKNQQNPGEIRVADLNDDGKISPEDRGIIGSGVPKFSFGFNNRAYLRGLDLNVFLYGRIGQTISSEAAASYKIDGLENGTLVDYWTPENPTNAYPRPNAATSRESTRYFSTLQYKNGSFIKIRDITLGYTFEPKMGRSQNSQSIRIYTTLKNYFVLSKMSPYDPERGGSLSFPMTKQIVVGLNLSF